MTESGVAGGTDFLSGFTAPGCAATTGIVASWLAGAPSKANPGAATGMAPNTNAKMIRLDVRITLFLVRTTWVGNRATNRGPNLLGVFPQHTRCMVGLAGLPFGLTFGELRVGQLYVKCADHGVDLDDVAVLQQADRAANGRFRPDVTDAEATGGAGEPAVGDERDFTAHALPGQRRGGREHLPHARTAARPLIADHDDLALFVGFLLDRLEGVLFALKAAGRTGKFEVRHTRNLHDRTVGREIPLQADHTASDGDRLVSGPHHILVRIPFHAFEVLGNRAAGDGKAIAVQMAIIEQSFHQKRYATSFEHVFGDITAARLQIRDIRCLFEDFRYIEQVELDAAFMSDGR